MREFLRSCRYFFSYAFLFSFFINILQLTFSIYMLQVFDKVLTSYNISTLLVITVAALISLSVLAVLEWIRSRLLVRAGIEFDKVLSSPVLLESLKNSAMPEASRKTATLRDVQVLRNFLGGSAVFAFFDAPWMPIFFIMIFMLHPLLGMVAVCGGVFAIILGVLTERTTKKRLESANLLNNHASNFLSTCLRNAPIIRSMGMMNSVSGRWEKMNNGVIELQTRASKSAGLLQSISKSMRLSLQVLIYAVGAYLAVTHQASAGIMIAASIIMGRALGPIDQGMASYKLSLEAFGAYKRLNILLDNPPQIPTMEMPAPTGALSTEGLVFGVQGRAIIKGITFGLPAGHTVALIGPSAAGKSTLCKLLLGIWPPNSGKVRLDGVDLASWDTERLGPYIGYLAQDVELFSGSIAENIARMGEVDSDKVIEAARLAGVHEMVLSLPKGYDTQIGEHGAALSGGQRQRIGLARAIYGKPKLLVLDEPNSNLDEEGERCLLQTLIWLKQLGTSIVLVTHKPHVLSIVDFIMLLQDGQVAMYGPRQDVLANLTKAQQQREQQQREQHEKQMALQKHQQELQQQTSNAAQQHPMDPRIIPPKPNVEDPDPTEVVDIDPLKSAPAETKDESDESPKATTETTAEAELDPLKSDAAKALSKTAPKKEAEKNVGNLKSKPKDPKASA